MRQIFRQLLLVVSLLACVVGRAADKDITFLVNSPRVVAVGEPFRIEFTVNAKLTEFVPPQMEGADILAGPSTSTGSSINIVNGSMTKTTESTITYVVQYNAKGKYTISPAEVEVGGKSYKSASVPIEVIEEAASNDQSNAPDASSEGATAQAQPSSQSKTVVAADDILVRLVVDKTNVYKGQPVRATYKLYTRVQLRGIESAKYPSFNGFWTQELTEPQQQTQWQRETYNGKIYDATTLREYLLFPQQSGMLTIEPLDMTVIAQIVTQARRQSLFDDFFSGGPQVQEIRRALTASPLKISVNELPAGAPESFTGAVGEFTLESTPPSERIAANSAATYSIKINGRGNLPLIQAPKLNLPSTFEQYNIKTTESLKSNSQGISGYRQFDYPFIARAEGEYDIPAAEFTYFNPNIKRYVTLSSRAMNIEILPDTTRTTGASSRGIVSGLSKEEIKILGQDIRFIKIDDGRFKRLDRLILGGGTYAVVVGVLAALFAGLLVFLRKLLKEQRNIALLKGKRANKVALQRFRSAERFMKEQNERGFYEEMLRALWGYMSDKLNIPVANLTKENVSKELLKRGVTETMAMHYVEIISTCEYAQYAPSSSGKMEESYTDSVDTVSKLESIINR